RPVYAHEIMQRPSAEGLADLLADITALAPMARPAPRKNPRVAFILSSARSGSTLLRIMLAGHPALFCPPELNLLFFEDMQEWQQNIGFGHELEWTSAGVQWALMELLGLESAPGQACVDDLVTRNESTQQVYARLQALADPRLLIDKTPT